MSVACSPTRPKPLSCPDSPSDAGCCFRSKNCRPVRGGSSRRRRVQFRCNPSKYIEIPRLRVCKTRRFQPTERCGKYAAPLPCCPRKAVPFECHCRLRGLFFRSDGRGRGSLPKDRRAKECSSGRSEPSGGGWRLTHSFVRVREQIKIRRRHQQLARLSRESSRVASASAASAGPLGSPSDGYRLTWKASPAS